MDDYKRLSKAWDHVRVIYFMQNIIVDETEHFIWQMLWKLGNKCQSEPTFSSATSDPRDLLKQYRHLRNSLRGEEFMRFFNENHGRCRRQIRLNSLVVILLLLIL